MTAGIARGFIEALRDAGVEASSGDDVATHRVDGSLAQAVAYPATLQELARLMKAASGRRLAVAPWGGGTRSALGNPLERLDVIVDLSRLNRVVEHNPADLTITVQAGITLGRLQELLGEHGQFLALDPPLPDRATLGGTLATGASGPLKWMYGSPRDVVIGMKVVQAGGTVTKSGGQVVKNVSGYDMTRLHIGGLGTLGVIAEVSLKLTPLPAGQATVVAGYGSIRQCLAAGLGIFHGDVVPLAIAAVDAAAGHRMDAPGLGGGSYLAVRLGGRPLTLERQIKECRSVCKAHGPSRIEVLGEADAAGMWRRLADYGWDERTAPVAGIRAHLPPAGVPELAEALKTLDGVDDLRPAIVAHPAHGTVLINWYQGNGAVADGAVETVLRSARQAVHRLGGKLTIERCPVAVKSSLDIWDDVGEPVAIMRRLKEQYDSQRVLNPGRFVGGI